MNNPVVLEARGLTYSYEPGVPAIRDISLSLRAGEVTGILGGNGAGKSTLFLTLNRILNPDSGEILLKGEPVGTGRKDLIRLRQSVGIVFQDPGDQLFSADVFQDIAFGPLNLGLPEEEVRSRVALAAARAGVEDLMDRPVHQLSFGQKKRVAIAGVLAMNPEVLILDEPTAGLDPRGVSSLLDTLGELQKKQQMAIVLATHDIDLVPLFCDSVYVMDGGQLVMEGTPEELLGQPELLRRHSLRLPRISHLMEVLRKNDHLDTDERCATISSARKCLKEIMRNHDES